MENLDIDKVEIIDKRTLRSKGNRTENQIKAWEKIVELRALKRQERKEKREEEQALREREIEEKILKKALAIKKRQIKEDLLLNSIKDDETPVQEIKNLLTKQKTYNFI